MNQNIQRAVSDSGIATLTFDRPDSTANIFDQRTLDELNGHLDFLESERSLKGLIIRTAKSKIFIAGADLNAFTQEISAPPPTRGGRFCFVAASSPVSRKPWSLCISVSVIHSSRDSNSENGAAS